MTEMIHVMNTVYRGHSETKCLNLNVNINQEIKFGLEFKTQMKCTNCGYISKMLKTYTEIESSKAAVVNTNLAMALMDTSMGIAQASVLFTALDLPFPAASHLQTLTNKVSQKVIQLNCEDMSAKRKLVEQHNRDRGAKEPKQIALSAEHG